MAAGGFHWHFLHPVHWLTADLNPSSLPAIVPLNGSSSWVNSIARLGPPGGTHVTKDSHSDSWLMVKEYLCSDVQFAVDDYAL